MNATLTEKQQGIRKLVAHGYSAKEIADKTGNTVNTINTHIRNIKLVRDLQKISEIAADYWCEVFGTSLEEQRKSILSSVTCLIFLLSFSMDFDNQDRRRLRTRRRNDQMEQIAQTQNPCLIKNII